MPERRGEIRGWSRNAARRNRAFLWSVNVDRLGDFGLAVTLTCGATPETAEAFTRARVALIESLRRAGVSYGHWVIEWTRKGRPHLHLAVYGNRSLEAVIIAAWFRAADREGWPVSIRAQHVSPITDARGWLAYVAKHASKGVENYQRIGAPDGWAKTGKMWGHFGDWPIELPIEADLEWYQYHRFRRLVRAYQRAMLPVAQREFVGRTDRDRKRGYTAGVSGWVPDSVALVLLELAVAAEPHIDYRKWD